jgi:hypothetical protein
MGGLALLAGLAASYSVLQDGGLRLPYLQVSNLHEIILLACELFLCLWLYRVYARAAWGEAKKVTYLLVYLLANCFIAVPFLLFYLDKARSSIPLVRVIQPYLLPGYYALLALTVLMAIFAWVDVRRFHAWLVTCNDGQRLRDDQDASARREGLRQSIPWITHLPVLGWAAQEVYAEGWGAWLALGLAAAGLVLRLWNLEALPPYSDETIHMGLGKAVLQGAAFTRLDYTRSLYSVTLPVVWSMKAFGATLWAARFPGVLANSLASIPLYLLARRVNRPVASLAVGLLAFNPWMVATARTVREYAFYPLYFYLTAWLMVRLYESLPDRILFLKDYPRLLTLKNLAYAGMLALIIYYAYGFDHFSTFKVILGAYLAFGLILLRKVEWRNGVNVLLMSLILAGAGFLAWKVVRFTGLANDYFFSLLFDHPEQQWYYNRPLIIFLVLLAALLAVEYLDVKKAVLPLFALSYGITQISFVFLTIKGDKPRYAVAIEFWYILVVAAGLFAVFCVGQRLFKYRTAVWVGLLLLFWNVPQTLTPSLNTAPGYAPITYEYHADMAPAFNYLKANARESDALVASDYLVFYLNWTGGLNFTKVIPLQYLYPRDQAKIYAAVDSYPSGWIVLYSRGDDLYGQPIQPEDFEVAGKVVKFIGWYGDAYIFHW